MFYLITVAYFISSSTKAPDTIQALQDFKQTESINNIVLFYNYVSFQVHVHCIFLIAIIGFISERQKNIKINLYMLSK